MAEVRHSVRKQTLRVTASSEALALAIRPQVEAINRSAFLPIIERVFDEFAGTDLHLRIDRLDVDLGRMLASDVDRLAPGRFEQALREQLLLALYGSGAGAEIRSNAEAMAEATEQLLLTGTLPFWAAGEPRGAEAAVLEWIAIDPAAVRRLFHRHRMNEAFMRRIVLTLSDEGLRRLLHTLAPDDAAAMIVYLTEIRALHRLEPVVPVTDAALGRLLWAVTLDYVANDSGSQFNRKSFVRTLLAGVAEAERLTYQDVLSVFDLGLSPAAAEPRIAATLLEVVAALVDDEKRVDPRFDGAANRRLTDYQREDVRFDVPFRYEVADALRYYLRFGELPWSIRLRHPSVSMADYVMQLANLPSSLLDSLVDDLPVEDWSDRWQHLLNHLSDSQLETLAGTLAAERTELRSALASIATLASGGDGHRRAGLTRALAAALAALPAAQFDGRLEFPRPSFPLVALPDPAHVIRSLLTARLVEGGPGDSRVDDLLVNDVAASAATGLRMSSTALLAGLIDAHPADTRVWLQEVVRAGHSPAALIDAAPTGATLDSVRRRLTAPHADALQVVTATLAALPPAARPGTDAQIDRILLEELLAAWSSGMPAVALQQRIFARLFPDPSSGPASELVADVVAGLADREAIAKTSRQLFGGAPSLGDASGPAAGNVPSPEMRELDAGAIEQWLSGVSGPRDGEAAGGDVAAGAVGAIGPVGAVGPVGYDRDTFNAALDRLAYVPSTLVTHMRRHLGDPRARARWTRELSERNRARVFGILAAGDGARLLDTAERLFSGWQAATGGGERRQREDLWLFLFAFLANTPPSARTIEQLTRQFFAWTGQRHRTSVDAASRPQSTPSTQLRLVPLAGAPPETATGAPTAPDSAGERTWRAALLRAERDGDVALRQILQRDQERLRQEWDGPGQIAQGAGAESEGPARARERAPEAASATDAPSRSRQRAAFSLDDEREAGQGDPIYIANAGLVIAAPFLPRLFQALEMIETDAAGKTRIRPARLSRAVHLLQWAVTGRTDTPEPALCLNKVLCGVAIAVPVAPAITPTPRELEIGTALLTSIIANWAIVKNTSIDGLRETFLQRDGRLERIAHGWRLEVQRKTLDVLLDQLPWSVSTVMHSLMADPIFVKW